MGDAALLTPAAEPRVMHDGVPASDLHVPGRCGHLPAMERRRVMAELMRAWLQRCARHHLTDGTSA